MFKVLKSFCCLLLFLTLNLRGVSAVDYITFDNHNPFKCSKCGKLFKGCWEFLNDIVKSNKKLTARDYFALGFLVSSSSKSCMAYVRSDNRKALMCFECGVKDINERIKSLVKEFCPEFNFQSPRRQDVENLIRNNQFIQKIPMEYLCDLGVFEDEKYVCEICSKSLGVNGPEMFEKGNYPSCVNCGNVFHVGCVSDWRRSGNKTCPVCNSGSGLTYYNGIAITIQRMHNFVIWVNDGCPSSFQSRLEFFKNASGADFDEKRKFREELKKCTTLDKVLDLLFPGEASAPVVGVAP